MQLLPRRAWCSHQRAATNSVQYSMRILDSRTLISRQAVKIIVQGLNKIDSLTTQEMQRAGVQPGHQQWREAEFSQNAGQLSRADARCRENIAIRKAAPVIVDKFFHILCTLVFHHRADGDRIRPILCVRVRGIGLVRFSPMINTRGW